MKPEQFEQYIATTFSQNGYKIKLTSKSYDYGVDIIAIKQDEKIAIQVKMYDTRLVNYKDVMYLYAGKDFYDCNKALLITAGHCDNLAINAAAKLGVEIHENYVAPKFESIMKTKVTSITDSTFDEVWERFIKPLKGQEIYTATGKRNIIVEVKNDFLIRKSSTEKESKIEKQIFKTIYYRLKDKKTLTRDEINTEYSKRGSAIICAVLGRVPFITLKEKPKVTITLNLK